RVALVDCRLQRFTLADELATHIDISRMRAHRETGNEAAFHERMRIMPQDVSILAGARFRLVRIDDQIVRPLARFLRHEGPFEAGRKAGTAAAAQPRGLHLVDDPVPALLQDGLRAVPMAARHRALKRAVELAVYVGEDAVLVLQHLSLLSAASCRRRAHIRRHRPWPAPRPASPSPRARSVP